MPEPQHDIVRGWNSRETIPLGFWEFENTPRIGEYVVTSMGEGHISYTERVEHS
jgi:hypothetical protein